MRVHLHSQIEANQELPHCQGVKSVRGQEEQCMLALVHALSLPGHHVAPCMHTFQILDHSTGQLYKLVKRAHQSAGGVVGVYCDGGCRWCVHRQRFCRCRRWQSSRQVSIFWVASTCMASGASDATRVNAMFVSMLCLCQNDTCHMSEHCLP